MIEVHFIGKSGRVHKDKAGDKDFLYETHDGIHPLSTDSVYRDEDPKSNRALVVLWDFIISPYGARTSKEYIEAILGTITMAHETEKQVRFNSLWVRTVRGLLGKYLGPVIVLIFVSYALLGDLLGGAGYGV